MDSLRTKCDRYQRSWWNIKLDLNTVEKPFSRLLKALNFLYNNLYSSSYEEPSLLRLFWSTGEACELKMRSFFFSKLFSVPTCYWPNVL